MKDLLTATAGCLGMQLPYLVNGKDGYDGYSNHWYWDNVSHFLGGYSVGRILATKLDSRRAVVFAFLAITTGWELFEYKVGERPWHTDENGDMEWEWDHAMEDTALDTVMGAIGAWLAATVALR